MAENDGEVYIAKRTAHVEVDGARVIIRKGVTRVREGHPLLSTHADLFQAAGDGVRFDIEDAMARPATREKMGSRAQREAAREEARDAALAGETVRDSTVPQEPVKPYSEWGKKELQAELKKRNADRDADKQIDVPSRASVDTLAELLATDDTTPVETGVMISAGGDSSDGVVVSDKTPDGIHPDARFPGVTVEEPVDWETKTIDELKAEIATRNGDRPSPIEVAEPGNKPQLVAALQAADQEAEDAKTEGLGTEDVPGVGSRS